MEKKNQKYQIADIQQDKLLHMGLDLKDAYILTYLKDMSQVKKIVRKEIDGLGYIWVDYEKLMSYLPVLKIKTVDALYRRFKKYVGLKLVRKHNHRVMTGTYTFFYLEESLFDLFEITKISQTDDELDEQLKKMGLTSISDEKSGGFGLKVGSISDEKSGLNTPINNTPINNSSSTEEKDPTAASHNEFIKNLKELLSGSSIKNLNPNTLKNIITFSNDDIQEVERAIAFMKLKNKSMTPSILVAILRDGDFKEKGSITPKNVKRNDKVKFMAKKLGEIEIRRLRNTILREIGFECSSIDDQLGNILCRKFNTFLDEGGIYV